MPVSHLVMIVMASGVRFTTLFATPIPYTANTLIELIRISLTTFMTLHRTSASGDPCASARGGKKRSLFGAGDAGIDARGTRFVLHRNTFRGLQSMTFADCVSRLFVEGSCRLSLPSIVPPTVAFPHLGWITSVPRLIP